MGSAASAGGVMSTRAAPARRGPAADSATAHSDSAQETSSVLSCMATTRSGLTPAHPGNQQHHRGEADDDARDRGGVPYGLAKAENPWQCADDDRTRDQQE